jgi:hypothetical protein
MTERKTTKQRKPRADSKEQAALAMIHANKRITPPADMDFTSHQVKIFNEIIDEFAKIDWTKHTIRLAAILARSMSHLQEMQDDLTDEGYTVTGAKGGLALNPKASAANQLSSQIMSQRRTLALHAMAGSSGRGEGKRRGINKSSEDDSPLDDEDFATPHRVSA